MAGLTDCVSSLSFCAVEAMDLMMASHLSVAFLQIAVN